MISISFLAMDLLMDLCVLIAVQCVLGRFHPRRLAAAQLALSLFTLLSLFLGRPGPIARLCAALLCCAALCAERRPLRILEGAALMICASASPAP